MGRIARVPYQGQAGDFRLMSRRVVDTVRRMPERRRFLRGMVAWVGFKQISIDYRRAGRTSGRGASYPALFRLAFEAIVSFSDVPLRLATYLGVAIAILSGLGAFVDSRVDARRRPGDEHRGVDPRRPCSSSAASS